MTACDQLQTTRLALSVPLKATVGIALWRFSWSSFGDPNRRRSSKLPKRKQFLHSDGAQARKKTDLCRIQFFDECEGCHDGVTESPKVVSSRRGGRRKSIAAEPGITTRIFLVGAFSPSMAAQSSSLHEQTFPLRGCCGLESLQSGTHRIVSRRGRYGCGNTKKHQLIVFFRVLLVSAVERREG